MKKLYVFFCILSMISVSNIKELEEKINSKILNDKLLDEMYEFRISNEEIKKNYYINKVLKSKPSDFDVERLYNDYIERVAMKLEQLKEKEVSSKVKIEIDKEFKGNNIVSSELYEIYKLGDAINKLVPTYKNKIVLPDENIEITEDNVKIKMFLGWNISEILFDLVNREILEDAEIASYTDVERDELDKLLKSNKVKLFYKNAFEIEFKNDSNLTYEETIKEIYIKYVEGVGQN